MKKALPFSAPRKTVLLLVLTAVLLTAVFCSLTFVRFSSQLYIKRSPNTFVGDEKYVENRAVVEQELETLRSQGVDGEIAEEVIERVNSKNEKTSLVIFTINAANTRNGWDLLSAGVPSSRLLILILALSVLAWGLTLFSAFTGNRAAGIASFVLSLCAFFLIPVIFNRLNLDLSRTVDLYQNGAANGADVTLFPALDKFLFGGTASLFTDQAAASVVLAAGYVVIVWLFLYFLHRQKVYVKV